MALINILPFRRSTAARSWCWSSSGFSGRAASARWKAAAYVVGMACLLTFIAWIS